MALIKITDGVKSITVTQGAYEGIYKNLGFEPADKVEEEVKVDPKEKGKEGQKDDGKSENEIFAEELLEKPISEWSKDEVKRFAEIKEIDISETKNPGQAKEVIGAWLEENDK